MKVPAIVSEIQPPKPFKISTPTQDEDFELKEKQLKEQLEELNEERKRQYLSKKMQEEARIKENLHKREELLEDARQFEELSLRAVTPEDKTFYVQEARKARKQAAEIAAEISLPEDEKASQESKTIEHGVSTTRGIWGLVILLFSFGILFWAFGSSEELNNPSAKRMLDSGGLRFISNIWMSLGSLIFGFLIQWALFPQQFFYYHSKFNTERCLKDDFINPSHEGFYRMASWFASLALPIWVFVSIFQVILA